MRMKRVFAAGALLLALTPNFAAAQEYYTLPEIREQAKDGWHETYTDKYGRKRLWISTWRCTAGRTRRFYRPVG